MSASLITANAGCGKTWTLANRCIGWMVDRRRATGQADPAGLVAVTFTRKAAGEILQRVLDHLSSAIVDPDLARILSPGFDLHPPATTGELTAVLEEVAAHLHRLQFGTLDGLYHRIASSCSSMINMPVNWSIGDEPSMIAIRSRALDDLLDTFEASTIDVLVHEAEQDVLRSQVHAQLLPGVWGDRGGGGMLSLWRRTVLDSGDRAWRWIDDLSDGDFVPGAVRQEGQRLDQSILDLESAMVPLTQKGSENQSWARARARLVALAGRRRWLDVLEETLVERMVTGQSFNRHQPPEEFGKAVEPLLRHARAELADSIRSRMRSWRLLLHGLDGATRRRQREAGIYSFSDVSDLLATRDVLEPQDREWLQFQLDGELRDLALDEFQDTSLAQFKVIEPVIDEILAGDGAHDFGRSLLIVADPKQAIYGWRGGTPALIGEVRNQGGSALGTASLDKSYRSGPAVIGFVNAVFGSIRTNEAILGVSHPHVSAANLERCGLSPIGHDRSPTDRALDDWNFTTHETARPDEPGAVMAWRLPWSGRRGTVDLDAVAGKVTDIVSGRRGRSGSIGILMLTNAGVARVVEALRAAGIPASEEGAGALSDSVAAATLLDVLRLGDHPDHTAAAYSVSHSPFGPVLDLPFVETLPAEEQSRRRSRVSALIRRRVLDDGLPGFLRWLTDSVRDQCCSEDAKAFDQCLDLARSWQSSGPIRLSDFVMHVLTSSAGEASPADVRVMTIHASKGLEFDEVILPVLDQPMITNKTNMPCLPWAESVLEPVQMVVPNLKAGLRLHAPVVESASQQRWMIDLADRLSLLYVALTRARHVINLVLHESDQYPGKSLTYASVLRAAIPSLDEAVRQGSEDDQGRIWIESAAGWSDATRRSGPAERVPSAARPIRFRGSVDSPVRVRPSAVERSLDLDPDAWPRRRTLDRGTELHELFSLVEWIEDGLPDEVRQMQTIHQAGRLTGRPASGDQMNEVRRAFERSIAQTAIEQRLRRSVYEPMEAEELLVFREWPILQEQDGELIQGRIDRLVVGLRDGKAVFAEIIDFKSGRPPKADDEAVAPYRDQMSAYARAVRSSFRLAHPSISARLLFIEAGRDLPCTPWPISPSSS